MKIQNLGKTVHSIKIRKLAKPSAIGISGLLIISMLMVFSLSVVQAETGTTTFGTTTVGGSGTTFSTGVPRATQYTPGSSGTVTDVMLYLTISGAGGHAQVAIYANSGNAPGALLAKSSSDAITSNGWHDFKGFNVAVTGGVPYWLACESDSGNLLWYYNSGGANYCQGTGYGYGTFPNPYTRASSGNYQTSIYAIYTSSGSSPTPTPTTAPTPSSTPTPTFIPSPTPTPTPSGSSATFGTTTIGASSTTFNYGLPRATQYKPASSGTLTDIMLYLSGSGRAQVAIYADGGNAPGALLAKSSSDAITSNGWHDFKGFNVAVTGGVPYWLACESDSGNLLWYYNSGGANYCQGTGYGYGTFPNPYTRASSGNYQTSIYAIYTSANSPQAPSPTPTSPTPTPTSTITPTLTPTKTPTPTPTLTPTPTQAPAPPTGTYSYTMDISGSNYRILNSARTVIYQSTSSSSAFNWLLGSGRNAASGSTVYVGSGRLLNRPHMVHLR